jgi:hypothetical protein
LKNIFPKIVQTVRLSRKLDSNFERTGNETVVKEVGQCMDVGTEMNSVARINGYERRYSVNYF